MPNRQKVEYSKESSKDRKISLPAIIYPFENYASKELPSFSQIANNIVIDDSSADESIIEDNVITHYEKFNSEEGKQIILI